MIAVNEQFFPLGFAAGLRLILLATTVFVLAFNALKKGGIAVSIGFTLCVFAIYALANLGNFSVTYYLVAAAWGCILTTISAVTGGVFFAQLSRTNELIETDNENGVYHYRQIQTIIEAEFARAFRYNFPIVLIRLEGRQDHLADQPTQTLNQLDHKMMRFLATNLRVTDILVRMDGINDFLVICPNIETEEAEKMLNRLTRVAAAQDHFGFQYTLNAFPKDGHSFEELFEQLSHQ
jgi:GGDEF domain-containing protein